MVKNTFVSECKFRCGGVFFCKGDEFMSNLLFSKQEMANFVVRWLRIEEPDIRLEPVLGMELVYNVFMKEDPNKSGMLNLRNIWTAYQRSKDINTIIDGLNGHLRGMRFCREWGSQGIDYQWDKVFPTLRPKNYARLQLAESKLLCDKMVPELDTVFCERREGLLLFIDRDAIPEQSADDLRNQAYANLHQQGWIFPVERFPGLHRAENGVLHIYYDVAQSFQLQFFIEEMRSAYLPKTFLVAFPSFDTAVVLTMDIPLLSVNQAQEVAMRSGMMKLVHMMNRREQRPLATHIYWIRGLRTVCLFRSHSRLKGVG
jgi:hypothetical protein